MPDPTAANTELAEAQQRLRVLEESLAQMCQQQETLQYNLSHDLRTPVMTILGFTDLLIADLKNVGDEQMARQYLEHIRNSANRQATLIESLLKLSQLSRQPLHLEPVDLTQIAVDYWQSQSDLSNNKHIIASLLATPTAMGDRALLTQAIHALLGNAIKFTSKQTTPEITFGAEQLNGQLSYFVRDNGVGFNSQRSERLFQPFRRLHSSKDYEGLGMGLAITALIVQRHHGRLWADSAVDQGTTMHFTLGSP